MKAMNPIVSLMISSVTMAQIILTIPKYVTKYLIVLTKAMNSDAVVNLNVSSVQINQNILTIPKYVTKFLIVPMKAMNPDASSAKMERISPTQIFATDILIAEIKRMK